MPIQDNRRFHGQRCIWDALRIAVLYLLLVCGWALDVGATEPVEGLPRYRALVIGVGRYLHQGAEGWPRLLTARQDAEAVADILEAKYGFETVRLLDEQATLKNVLAAFDALAACTELDAVLVYYAGHGYYDEALGEGFWIPYDAQFKENGRPARDRWIWNSVLTKIIEASPARHVLVIADSCFGGALFRGAEGESAAPDMTWYARALMKPSRFLITSGDHEPVLDSGAQHSIFAQLLLNALTYPDKACFSASDIGLALRDRVGEMTGQMVRMGPLSVATHAGGEFIFLDGAKGRSELAKAMADETWAEDSTAPVPPPVSATPAGASATYRDIALLKRQGVRQTADLLLRQAKDDVMSGVLSSDASAQRAQDYDAWLHLLTTLEQKKRASKKGDVALTAPRVVAVMETQAASDRTDDEARAALFSTCMLSALKAQPRIRIGERDVLEEVLRELNLGQSDLSDPRGRLLLGRLLPAGALMHSRLIASGTGCVGVVRLIDTQTAEVLGVYMETVVTDEAWPDVCRRLAEQSAHRLVESHPFQVKADVVSNSTAVAELGSFHGLLVNDILEVYPLPASKGADKEVPQQPIGRATAVQVGEFCSSFAINWNPDQIPLDHIVLNEP